MTMKAVFCTVLVHFVAVTALCPNGWTRFLDSCYFFSHEAATFTESEHYCMQHGAHLVHVNSAVESSFLKSVLQELNRPKHWIGLTDRDIEGVWSWVDDNEPESYTDWHSGEPNQGNDVNCACMRQNYQYLWTDDPCDNKYYPICEKRTESGSIIG